MIVHIVSAFDKHNNDFVVLAVFSAEKDAEQYCQSAEHSERFDDVKVHHPKRVDAWKLGPGGGVLADAPDSGSGVPKGT